MKKLLNYISIVSVALGLTGAPAFAGNEDRAGQAGANELLINPWARTAGWGGCNIALVSGVEALSLNVAGMAHNKGTEVTFAQTDWMKGSDIKISAFGLAQKVGESGSLGLAVTSMNFGDIDRTTEAQPDGGLGKFTPQFLTIAFSYAKSFSNSIYGGLSVRMISESINDVKSQGIVVDAGIQYVTGFNEAKDDLKFGIALRNVGTPMKFDGEGLSFRNDNASSNISVLQQQRAERFEMPSLVAIGVSYDIKLKEEHRLTPSLSFTANSFIRDQIGLGVEYGFRQLFMLRAGYTFDKKDRNAIVDDEISALIGPSAGVSVMVPLGKSGKTFGIDYGYRATETFDGTHTIGARFNL
ncbi:MAG: PorV/PorQ family protein [Bacteroidetes bacterium]|nr:PorV/PorQ family protein [Bacteroidota bacterium]